MLAQTKHAATRSSSRGVTALVIAGTANLAAPTIWLTPAPAAPREAAAADDDRSATSPAAAQSDDGGGAVTVDLPGGAQLEVVAVGEHPSEGRVWWTPSGDLTAAPYKNLTGSVHDDASIVREIAIRWIKRPEEGISATWSVDGGGSTAGGQALDEKGRASDGLSAVARAFSPEAKTCSITVSVAAGAWQTLAETDGDGLYSEGGPQYTFAFTPTSHRDGKLLLTVSHNVVNREVRIVAVDRDGKTVAVGATSSTGGRGFLQSTAEFSDPQVDKAHAFCVQVRSLEKWQVSNISLWPGDKTKPAVAKIETDEREARSDAARAALRQRRETLNKVDDPDASLRQDEILRQRLELMEKIDIPRRPTKRLDP